MIKIDHDTTYYAISRYEEKDYLKNSGFWWNVEKRRWETSSIRVIRKLMSLTPIEILQTAQEQVAKDEVFIQQRVAQSQAIVSHITIPLPEGLQLRDYQKAAVEFIDNHPHTLLADEMGLGKTIEVIAWLNYRQPSKVLIICPKIAKYVWTNELQRWKIVNYNINVVENTLPINNERTVNIMHYEQLLKYGENMSNMQWDVMILDESHYIKNRDAKRTKYVLSLRNNAAKRILLTGTPVMNRPVELFTQLKVLDNYLAQSYTRFVSQYVVFDDYMQPSGGKNLIDLQERLRTSVMLRRMKSDVLSELPDKIRQIITLPFSILTKQQQEMEKEAMELYNQIITQKADHNVNLPSIKNNNIIAFENISKIRHLTVLAKLPMIITHLKQLLDSGEKVVVFAHHRDVIESIVNEFNDKCVKLTGDDNTQQRVDAIQSFQNDRKIQLFVASIKASGVAITLTAANVCVFAELDWTPSTIVQAEDRLHRIGQQKAVQSQFLVVENTIDSLLAQTLTEKSQLIHHTVDWESITQQHLEEML